MWQKGNQKLVGAAVTDLPGGRKSDKLFAALLLSGYHTSPHKGSIKATVAVRNSRDSPACYPDHCSGIRAVKGWPAMGRVLVTPATSRMTS